MSVASLYDCHTTDLKEHVTCSRNDNSTQTNKHSLTCIVTDTNTYIQRYSLILVALQDLKCTDLNPTDDRLINDLKYDVTRHY